MKINLSAIKCMFLGHQIKKFSDPNLKLLPSTMSTSKTTINPPVLAIGNGPCWMMEYNTGYGPEFIVHPCERCNVVLAVKKVGS